MNMTARDDDLCAKLQSFSAVLVTPSCYHLNQKCSCKILKKNLRNFFLYHTVPLGSIQQLPAESCSEIKASEG